MSEAVESEKVELRALMDEAYTQVPILKEGISNVNEMSQQLTELNQKLEREITDTFEAIAKMINDRKDELLRQLVSNISVAKWSRNFISVTRIQWKSFAFQKHTEACKQTTLAKQRDELETSLADLYTSCEFVEKALTHGSETEILLVKKQVGERLIEYGQMQVVTTPAENPYLVYEKGTLLLLFNARLNDKKNGVFFQFLEILASVYFFI